MTAPKQPAIRPRPPRPERPMTTPRPEIRPAQPPPERRGLDAAALNALQTAAQGFEWTTGAGLAAGAGKVAYDKVKGGKKKK